MATATPRAQAQALTDNIRGALLELSALGQEKTDLELLQETFPALENLDTDVLADRFYNRLFTLKPELQYVFEAIDDPENPLELLSQAVVALGDGTANDVVGGSEEFRIFAHYPTESRGAVMWLLELVLGDRFTPAVERAWVGAFDDMVGYASGGHLVVRANRFDPYSGATTQVGGSVPTNDRSATQLLPMKNAPDNTPTTDPSRVPTDSASSTRRMKSFSGDDTYAQVATPTEASTPERPAASAPANPPAASRELPSDLATVPNPAAVPSGEISPSEAEKPATLGTSDQSLGQPTAGGTAPVSADASGESSEGDNTTRVTAPIPKRRTTGSGPNEST